MPSGWADLRGRFVFGGFGGEGDVEAAEFEEAVVATLRFFRGIFG